MSHTPAQIEAGAIKIYDAIVTPPRCEWNEAPQHAKQFYRKTAAAALSAAEAAGWQTMESAPKGDEEIAVLIGNFCYQLPQCRVAYYDLEADPTYPWHVEDAAKGFNHHKDWPTHWRPLPAPPPPTGELK